MTTQEFRIKLHSEFGDKPYPATYPVDAATYGHICNSILKWNKELCKDGIVITLDLGPNGGILYKGIELVLTE